MQNNEYDIINGMTELSGEERMEMVVWSWVERSTLRCVMFRHRQNVRKKEKIILMKEQMFVNERVETQKRRRGNQHLMVILTKYKLRDMCFY